MDQFELHQRVFMRDYTPIIKKENLIHGEYYEGRCRNANVARWNAETGFFYHWRNKFGNEYVEAIHCPEDDEMFDVFVAARLLAPNEVKREIHFHDE